MFLEDPDFINDKGTKYWYSEGCTLYARKHGFNSHICWYVHYTDGVQHILLIDNTTNLLVNCFLCIKDFGEYITTVSNSLNLCE